MERVPFFRRTFWIFVLGSLAVGLPYALLFQRAAPTNLPGSLLILVPVIGAITASAALLLSAFVLLQIQGLRASLPVLLRTLVVGLWLLAHLVYLAEDQSYFTLQLIVFDFDLLALSLTLSLLIAAQFVLPVETGRDRLLAVRRLLGYALGERGPVTFVEEGQARQAYAEDQRPGPGVYLIDHTSAVVLRTDTAFTRAIGPGIAFSKPGERCAEALDLRPQIRRLSGPDSRADLSEAEATSEAITRDGISISAELSITFILDPGVEGSPRLGRLADKPPYDFNRSSVERAVYAHTFGEFGDVPWTRIPGLLVADVWREQVKQWSLNDLLAPTTNQPSPLDQICSNIQERLMPPSRKDFQKSPVAPARLSREMEILNARGIRILDISVTNLKLPEAIEEERSLRWREAWAGEIQSALQESTERVRQAREKGEREAEADLMEELGKSLIEALRTNKRPDRRETLLGLVADILRFFSSKDAPELEPHLREKLVEMQADLHDLPPDCQEAQDP